MNEYILKVMVWMKNKSFYSADVMQGNSVAAAAADAAYADAAYADAAYAAALTADTDAACAAYFVDKYFERTNNSRAEYEKEVSRRLNDNPMIIEMVGKRYKLVEVK